MKVFRILVRNIKSAFKSVIRNFSLSFASIICTTITLILVSIAIIITANVNNFTKDLENDLTIMVFLDRNASIDDANIIRNELEEIKNVDSISFESKEDVKNEMKNESEIFNTIMDSWTEENNPLQHEFSLKVKDATIIRKTANQIKKIEKVDSVKYGEDIIDQMVNIFSVVQKATIGIVIALILVTAFLISNTIKLTIFSRKNEIEIMRLVGTSNVVIRLPFLFEGFILGIIGAIIPIVITIYGYMIIYEKTGGYLFSSMIKMIKPFNFVFQVSILLLIIGAVVGMISSYRSVRKYLKV